MTTAPTLPTFAAPNNEEHATLSVLLNNIGIRATTPRINVLHYLNIFEFPVTAEMVSRCVDLPLSTAYRVLTTLEANNLAGVTFGRSEVTRWFRFLPEKPQHCSACGQSFYTEYA